VSLCNSVVDTGGYRFLKACDDLGYILITMKKRFGLIIGFALFLSPALALAQQQVIPQTITANSPAPVQSQYQVTNPLGGINSFCGLIKALLTAVISIGIPIAVLFIVYAGFKFVLARGNSGELQKARENLMYTLIGIAIFLGAWLLAMVIANTVNALGAGSGQSQIISCN